MATAPDTAAGPTLDAPGLFFTPSSIAATLGMKWCRVNYIIQSRRIEHIGRVGITRCYDADAVEAIRRAAAEIRATGKGRAKSRR